MILRNLLYNVSANMRSNCAPPYNYPIAVGRVVLLILILALHVPATATSSNHQLTGFSSVDYRQFFLGPSFSDQELGSGPSFVLNPEYYYVSDDRKHTFNIELFGRYDLYDDERTHADIRQLSWIYANDRWEISAGMSRVFWGVMESQHLVDIINQTDSVEDIDGEDKLGQPMIQLATFQEWGDLRFYYLPYFRERTFPGKDGRLRSSLVVDTDHASYEHANEQWYPSMALRYKKALGAWDIGLSHFHGVSRAPTPLIINQTVTPFYEIIDQTGIDLQYTHDAWLLKMESIGISGYGDYVTASSLGFEYTMWGIYGTDMDLGLLMEYHSDNRDQTAAPATIYDHDLFIGSRLSFNDVDSTEILSGAVVDTVDGSQFYLVEANRRLNEHIKLEFDARFFVDIDASNPEIFLQKDDFFQLRLAYYF